ncbi:hypothetical protein CPB86DRAFT_796816 [Serendipita vermifera]|nr:hypothetical protein CPB86DRAFT_796816 [Serendipita vermifera]
MAFQIPDHGGVNAPGYTYRPLPPTNTLNSPGTSYDNGYANTIATPSSPALSSLTGNRSYVPNSPDLTSSSSGRYPTSNEYDLSPPPTHHSRHNSRYPLMHSTSGGASDDGGRSAAGAAGAGAPGNAGGHDDEVVEIQARKIAPVNEKGERTLHRALDANQVTMITLGTTFGTGFLVGSGTALYQGQIVWTFSPAFGGPLGILISYLFVGFICYNTLTSLCEVRKGVYIRRWRC